MTNPSPNPSPKKTVNSPRNPQNLSREKYARLKGEAIAPYRGLRKFVYISFGASGAIGAFIFCLQLLAGRQDTSTLPSLALQIGVIALMVWLFRWENRKK